MSTYLGWTIVTMPTTPTAPASMEFQQNAIVGSTTNPFTGAQNTYTWSAGYKEGSVSMPPMNDSDAQAWLTFFESCNGTSCVFTFPAGVCTQFPNECTTDGTTPRYFRLKSNASKWQIHEGSVYYFTFEIREAL